MASETGSVVITVPPETLIASGFGLTMRNYSQGLRKRRRKKLTNSNIRAPIVARRVNRKIDPPTRRLPDLLRDVRELVVEARLRSDGLEVRVLRGGSGRVHRVPTRVRELDRVVADGGGATPDQDALGLLDWVRRGVEVETDVEGLYGGEVGDLEFGERRGVGARRMREGEGGKTNGESGAFGVGHAGGKLKNNALVVDDVFGVAAVGGVRGTEAETGDAGAGVDVLDSGLER